MAKRELLATIRDRYRESTKREKSRILDEFISVTGHHRKHGIRLLGQSDGEGEKQSTARGLRIYDEAVREAVIVIWEAADRICGKRLKAALPHLVDSMERHRHLDLDSEVRERLLAASAATRPGGTLRRPAVGIIHPQPGGHRRLHWLDRSGSPAGQGTVFGSRRAGSHRQTAALSHTRHRLGQRQRVNQRDAGTVLR